MKAQQQLSAQALQWSKHALARQQQRGFQQVDALLIEAFGEEVEDGFIMTGQAGNDARQMLKKTIQRLDHLAGSTLIASNGTVITTFRADKKRIRRLRAGHVAAA